MQLQQVRADISMSKHNSLWQPSRSRRVDEERQIFRGVDLCFPESRCARDIADTSEMLDTSISSALVSHDTNHILVQASQLSSLQSGWVELQLRDECLCFRILELEGQFFDSISGVRRRQDTASP
jgi:hypothetical protein